MMGHSTLQHLLRRVLAVTLLYASSCSAFIPRILKTNTHCIIVDDKPLCPGEEYHFESDFLKIAAGFPDNSKVLPTWKPYWEEVMWIGSNSLFDLPLFDKSMEHVFFGDDSCLYGNVGFGPVTVNAQLIKCINQHYLGKPYPNPWASKNYGPLVAKANLDLSEPAHNKKGASPMDYRKLPPEQGDPDNKLPAYAGFNPLIWGKHQNSQWGDPYADTPKTIPQVYDTSAPPISYPPKKIRPIKPFPAPGSRPDVYELPSFLPPCPKDKPKCNKRKSPEQIRKEGSVANPNTNVAMTDSSAEPTPAADDSSDDAAAAATTDGTAGGDTTATESSSTGTAVASTDGTSVASTDGTFVASTDGTTAASTDGTSVASTDGSTVASIDGTSAASTDGTTDESTYGTTVAPADGTTASTDGTVAPTDGITTSSTDTTVASLPSIDTTTTVYNQDLTAQAVPSDDTLFGKKSRRAFLHPRDFRVQMR